MLLQNAAAIEHEVHRLQQELAAKDEEILNHKNIGNFDLLNHLFQTRVQKGL